LASLRDELTGIYQQRGVLTPEVVVDEARPPTAPLHDRFEWDDSTAAEAYRRDQAHQLIQSVKLPIVYRPSDGKPVKVRAFQAVRTDQGNVYKPTEEVIQDPFLTKLVLQNMQREWLAMKARYDGFGEFYSMIRQDLEQQEAS
jgi:hypothetical protein